MPKGKLLLPAEIDCIMIMKEMKYSNCELARKLGVSEGTIRYRQKKSNEGMTDGRARKNSLVNKYAEIIQNWIASYAEDRRRPTIKLLYDILRKRHNYEASYDALRRYIGKHFESFYKKKTRIRAGTPEGKLLQIDWKEDIKIQFGEFGNWVIMNAMVGVLGFSSKAVVIFSEKKDYDSFVSCQQKIFTKLGGLPLVIRHDCIKTAIIKWDGKELRLNENYRSYLDRLGVEAFPARPGTATDKGKVEKRIRDIFYRLDFKHMVYRSVQHLQASCDEVVKELEKEWRCSATGFSVEESFGYEQKQLKPLPKYFPVIPVVEKKCKVREEGVVHFCNNYYQVPGNLRGRKIICINTGSEIILYHDGEEIERYEYLPQARGMVRYSQKVLQDKELMMSDRVRAWALEVAQRQVDIYHEILQGGSQ